MPLSLSEQLDNLYTTTWQQMQDTVRDQIFDATPFWAWLRDKGKLKEAQGGRFLTEPLQFAKTDNVLWITKGGTVPLNDFEFLTIAKFDWRYLVGSLVRFGVDDHQNRGKRQIINLMNAKFDNVQNSLIDELETRLFGTSGSSANAIDGLQHLVADDPTASATIGGIDQSQTEFAYWRNKEQTMTGESFSANNGKRMRQILNSTSNNLRMDAPDIIVSGQNPYELYEENLLDFKRIIDKKMGDLSFQHQVYKGIPMVWSPACANTRMYFLNTNFISFQYDPMLNFAMTEWKPIPEQVNDRAAQIILAGAMTVSRRRCQGVLHTIDTD